MCAVHALRPKHQFREWQIEQRAHLAACPVMAGKSAYGKPG